MHKEKPSPKLRLVTEILKDKLVYIDVEVIVLAYWLMVLEYLVMERFLSRIDRSDPESASLGVVEFSELSFSPKRIYWMSDFVKGKTRGNHAHKTLNQIFIAAQGTLKLELTDGKISKTIYLSKESGYLYITPGIWRVISGASDNAVLLVLADQPYDEQDYIRDWDQYLQWRSQLEHE